MFTDMLPHFQEARGDCFKSGPLLADVLKARMDGNVAPALNLGPPLTVGSPEIRNSVSSITTLEPPAILRFLRDGFTEGWSWSRSLQLSIKGF